MHQKLKIAAVIIAAAAAGSAAGCGSGSSSTVTTNASGGQADTAAVVAQAKAYVAKLGGSSKAEPTGLTPVTVPPGKTVGIVNCGVAIVGCQRTTQGIEKAVNSIGWKSITVAASGFTPAALSSALEQVVARKPDVILAIGGPDSARPQAMEKAKEAGIPVVSVWGGNTVQKPIAAPSAANINSDYEDQGRALAEFAIARSNGKATVVIQDDPVSAAIGARIVGFKKALKAAPGVKIVAQTPVTVAGDIIGAERTVVSGWLSRYPKGQLDYVFVGADAEATGAIQAINSAHRDDVKILGSDCELGSLKEISDDGAQIVCANTPLVEQGLGGLDLAIRILAGEKVHNASSATTLITKANAPAEGQFVDTFDAPAFYAKLWKR